MKRAALALAAALLLQIGCRTLPSQVVRLAVDDPRPHALLADWTARAGELRSLRGSARVSLDGARGASFARQLLALERPARLRVEVLGLLNQRIAVLATEGDVAAKLMAGMEAARDAGGDGRCSCNGDPTDCGCPVPVFDKSGHIGGMVVARANGKQQLLSVTIEKAIVDPEEIDMLQDLVVAAVNQALARASELAREELSSITGGLPIKIPGLF